MFDQNTVVKIDKTTVKNSIVEETISLNMKNVDNESFFIEAKRGSGQYNLLMGENPILIKREWHQYEEWEINCSGYPFNQIKRMEQGTMMDKKINVQVLQIQYSGNNNFMFNLKIK